MIDGARVPTPAPASSAVPARARRTKMLTHFNNITLRCERLFI